MYQIDALEYTMLKIFLMGEHAQYGLSGLILEPPQTSSNVVDKIIQPSEIVSYPGII